MIIQYKCGHSEPCGLWKDDLYVRINTNCPRCVSWKKLQPTTKVFVKGDRVMVIKRASTWRKQ